MHLYYDPADEARVTAVSYLGPAITPYEGYNPGYRIYTIDGNYANSSWVSRLEGVGWLIGRLLFAGPAVIEEFILQVVLDHETYIANLTEANESGNSPKWIKEYSAKDAYGLDQLLPADWDALMDQLAVDDDLFAKFWQ